MKLSRSQQSVLMGMYCLIIATATFLGLFALTGCNMGPSFKERCEAAGGVYEMTVEVVYWIEYDQQLKMPINKPHYIYDSTCTDAEGRDIDV